MLQYYIGRDWDDNVYFGAFNSYKDAEKEFLKHMDKGALSISQFPHEKYFLEELYEEKTFYCDNLGAKLINLTPDIFQL